MSSLLHTVPTTLYDDFSGTIVSREDSESASPISLLPREIIEEIILLALGHYDHPYRSELVGHLDTRSRVWVYSHVCRLWREESLRLLTGSKIRLNPRVDRYPAAVAALETLLSSSTGPLDIGFHIKKTEYTDRMLSLLASESTRWRDVDLVMDIPFILRLSQMITDLPILESIHLHSPSYYKFDAGRIDENFFSNVPNLRRVSLFQLSSIETLRLPWSQLTHFTATAPATLELDIGIINKMPNLVSFEATRLCDSNPSGPLIVPANLQFIGLNSVGDRKTPSRLRLPKSVTSFSIGRTYHNVVELFRRRSACLETAILGFSLAKQTPDLNVEFINWLPKLRNVTTLEVWSFAAEGICNLLCAQQDSTLLPNLKKLVISSQPGRLFDDLLWKDESSSLFLIDFLESRIPYGFKELCFAGGEEYMDELQLEIETRCRTRLGQDAATRIRIRFQQAGKLVWREPVHLPSLNFGDW